MPEPDPAELPTIQAHVARYASAYLGVTHGTPVCHRLVGLELRSASRLYRWELNADGRHMRIIAKVALRRGPAATAGARPRLGPPAEFEEKARLEFEALSMVARRFEAEADARFAWIRPLDRLPEVGALLMEHHDASSLRHLVSSPRVASGADARRARRALANAGAWLRIYHGLERVDATDRHLAPEAVSSQIQALGGYLVQRVRNPSGLRDLIGRSTARVLDAFADGVPAVLGHGDFAPRNVLVAADGSVAVIDMLARWRTAAYEDLAYFLTALELSPAVVLRSLLPAGLGRGEWRQLVLDGYYGAEPVPARPLALYEILVLLDRWAAVVERRRRRMPLVDRLADAAYARRIVDRLRILEA